MSDKKNLGRWGEKYACKLLRKKGYRIIARNVYIGGGELDIITEFRNVLVFVEVKTRRSDDYIDIVDSIDSAKAESLLVSCEEYLSKEELDEIDWRIDLVGILVRNNKVEKIKHYKGIL